MPRPSPPWSIHIAPIYDYWREPGAYIVSRYLRGGSLRAIEEGTAGAGSGPSRRRTGSHLRSAFAHRQGVGARDVGSSNILFDPEEPHLRDFLIRRGPAPSPSEDVRDSARFAKRLLPNEPRSKAPVGGAELGRMFRRQMPAEAARIALDPGAATAPSRRAEEQNPRVSGRSGGRRRHFFGRGELTRRLISRLMETGPGSGSSPSSGRVAAGSHRSSVRGWFPPEEAFGGGDDPLRGVPWSAPIDELESALLRITARPVSRLHDRLDSGSRGLSRRSIWSRRARLRSWCQSIKFEEIFHHGRRERELFLEMLRVAAVDPESRLHVS